MHASSAALTKRLNAALVQRPEADTMNKHQQAKPAAIQPFAHDTGWGTPAQR
jgi:hypothetical protein